MDNQIVAALIGLFGSLLAVILGYLLTRKKADTKAKTRRAGEVIFYDSKQGFRGYDLTGFSDYSIQQDVITTQDEWLGLKLQTYFYKGKESTFIPKNELIAGYRYFHASCEIKVISASYTFCIYMTEEPDLGIPEHNADEQMKTVDNTEWANIDFFLRALPNINYAVHIIGERQSGDGSLQIRNLVVAEESYRVR